MNNIRSQIEEYDKNLITYEGFDEAIVGIIEQYNCKNTVIYDKDKLIHILITKYNMTDEQAIEEYCCNFLGCYCGDTTPVFLIKLDI